MINNIYDISPVIDTGAALPVLLPEAKAQLNITFSDDDAKINDFIVAAIGYIEQYTNTKIRIYTLTILADLHCEMELPCGPHIAITSVQAKNGNGYDTLTLDTDYFIDTTGVASATGSLSFIRFNSYRSGKVKIVCTAGYGDKLPVDLKTAILEQVAFLYANRGDEKQVYAQQKTGICEAARAKAKPYRRLQWI